MSLPFGKPYAVSPLIRGIRFSLLLGGIIYGRIKQARYENMEDEWREEQAALKIIRDKEHAKLAIKIAKEENEVIKQIESGEYFKTDESEAPQSPHAKECYDDEGDDEED